MLLGISKNGLAHAAQRPIAIKKLAGSSMLQYRIAVASLVGLIAVSVAPSSHARSILVDDPTIAPPFGCEVQNWTPTLVAGNPSDPFASLDGNGTSAFFNPGTVVTGDNVAYCQPTESLAAIWASDSADPPNLASTKDSSFVATNGELYVWQASGQENPDAEVIIWTLPISPPMPIGGFELELNNWCGVNQNGDSPNANASFSWAGTTYTDSCATNAATSNDLLFDSSGALVGFVNDIVGDSGLGDVSLTSSVPGWSTGAGGGGVPTAVPEPSALALMGLGLAAFSLLLFGRRRSIDARVS